MPVTRQIGDILRVQKATKKVTKDGEIKYLVDERSNWCLFTADTENIDPESKSELIQLDDFELEEEEKSETDQQNNIINVKRYYMPYRYSGKIFNFAENEEKIVNNMRTWCKEFFSSSTVIENLLSGIKSDEKEKNLLCKVMKVYEHEQNLEEDQNDTYGVRLKDKNHKLWKVRADLAEFLDES